MSLGKFQGYPSALLTRDSQQTTMELMPDVTDMGALTYEMDITDPLLVVDVVETIIWTIDNDLLSDLPDKYMSGPGHSTYTHDVDCSGL